MIYIIILSVLIGALSTYYFFFKNFNFFKKHGLPYAKPLMENVAVAVFCSNNLADYVQLIYGVHPDAKYVGMFDFSRPIIAIRDPDLIRDITLKHFDSFMDHPQFVDETQEPFFGRNLISLRGEKWKETRAILSPAFTSSKMKSMFTLMSDYGINFCNYLAHLPPEKRIVDTKDAFTRYTNDVIATCAFGVSVDSMRNPNNEFYIYGREVAIFDSKVMLKMFIFRSLPWLARIMNLKFLRDEIANFFRDLVKTTIEIREKEGIVRPDMMQLMMESRGKDGRINLTIDDMIAQAFTFFFGGFESTSTLMCFAAHEIAVNDDAHERLQNEIDKVLEDNNGEASYEAINSMEYLDAVIYETLRMYPSGLALDRLCVKDYELPPALPGMKSLTIKEGQGIWIPVYGIHHDPKYFENPEKFNPERFLGDKKKHILNSGTFLTFGQGPRMCIGNRFAILETKVLLFHLLARCELQVCEKTPFPLKMGNDGLNLTPKGGFWLKIVPRKNMHRTITINNEKRSA